MQQAHGFYLKKILLFKNGKIEKGLKIIEEGIILPLKVFRHSLLDVRIPLRLNSEERIR